MTHRFFSIAAWKNFVPSAPRQMGQQAKHTAKARNGSWQQGAKDPITAAKKMRATFVMEQHLGHQAFYQNLRRSLAAVAGLEPTWVEITYTNTGGWWEGLPLLPRQLRGILSGRQQAIAGLRGQPNDLVFFNTQAPAALIGRALKAQPYILCTDITPLQYDAMSEHYAHRPDRNPLLKWYKHAVNCRRLQGAAHLVPWSHWVAHSLRSDYGVPPERITVVPPGVDLKRWQPGLPTERKRPIQILFVGGDFYRKGGDLLLQAFRALPPGVAELRLVTRTQLPAEAGVSVRNDLQPNAPALLTLYQTSDLFVLPTRAEAFGIAAVEAGAAGLPVIASNVGGVSDIVVHEETGLLMPPDDAPALQAALAQLIEQPTWRQHLGHQARARVEQEFDAHKNALRIHALMEECLRGK